MTPVPTRTADWRRFLARLRIECPTAYPVVVRRGSVPHDTNGDCSIVGAGASKRFLIRIGTHLCFQGQLLALAHEWGHALSWRENVPQDEHDAEFALGYLRAYKAIFE